MRDEPLSLELHNTAYANAGTLVDGLGDPSSAEAWLAAIAGRLPIGGVPGGPTADELVALRAAVRDALHATLAGTPPPRASIDAINASSRRAPHARVARWHSGAQPRAVVDFGDATRADVVLSALAADAVDLVTGPPRAEIRACGAPGCVLVFLRQNPRRAWCSDTCGNRARQARHYRRARAG